MQYTGMPLSWVDFYPQGFETIMQRYNCNISPNTLATSIQILKNYNPRISKREIEYSPEYIFSHVLEHWNLEIPLNHCIETFWSGLNLKAELYPETLEVLLKLKERGYVIATLTDLPNAMPDEIFKRDIPELIASFDFYVSSSLAGYRKPHPKGLQMISEKYAIPMSQLIFIGDEEKDRKTAQNAKCKFIQIQRNKPENGSIHDLRELLPLLG